MKSKNFLNKNSSYKPFVFHFCQLAIILHFKYFHTHLVSDWMSTSNCNSITFFKYWTLKKYSAIESFFGYWLKLEIIWTISYGPYGMDHIIWSVWPLTFTVVSEQSWSVNILYSIIATSHKNANFWPCSWTLLNPSSAVFILVELTTFHNRLHFKLGSRTFWTSNPLTFTVFFLPPDLYGQEHNLVWHLDKRIKYGI